jgi:hypothetical protein
VPRESTFIPQVTIKTGMTTPEGREEQLTEYLCDWPGCANVATQVLGYAKEIAICVAVCEEHAPTLRGT